MPLSYLSSISAIPAWRESLSRVNRSRHLHGNVTWLFLIFDYAISYVRFCYSLQHLLTLNISFWQWIRKLFTVWLLLNVFVLPILQLPLRPCHCHLHVYLQAHPIHFQWQLLTTNDTNKPIRTALTETKHCSQCTVGVVYCVQNNRQGLN